MCCAAAPLLRRNDDQMGGTAGVGEGPCYNGP